MGLKRIPQPVLPPVNLVATPGDMMVQLEWDPYDHYGSDADEFHVKKSGGIVGTYDPNVLVDDGSKTGYTDTFVINGTTYTYALTAKVGNDESQPSNQVEATPASGAFTAF